MGKDGNAEVKATSYGGYFKGEAPSNIDSTWGRGESIRRYVLDSHPDKIHSAGENYHTFKNQFQAQGKGDDILQFLYKAGKDLDNAWYGNQSSAYIAQTHLSWLFEAAKELIEACDTVGTSLKEHSESLKSLKEYFKQTEGSLFNKWFDKGGLTSHYQEEVYRKIGEAIGPSAADTGSYDPNEIQVKTDVGDHKTEFEYTYTNKDGAPPEAAKTQLAEITNQVARSRLKQHDSKTGEQFNKIPYMFNITLPPDVMPTSESPHSPPHDPGQDRGNPGDKQHHQQPSPTYPADPGAPRSPYVPTNTMDPHQTPTGTPNLPQTPSSPSNGTHLSGQPHQTLTPTSPDNKPITNPHTPNLPNTNHPTQPTYSPTPISSGKLPQTSSRLPRTDTGLPRSGNRFPRVETGLPRGLEGPGSPARPGTIGTPGEPGMPSGSAGPGVGRSGVVGGSQAAAAEEAAMARTAQQAASRGGQGMMPFMPMGGMGMNGEGQELHRQTFLCEDEETWAPDDDATPPLIC